MEDYKKFLMPQAISENLHAIFTIVIQEFIPYMQANESVIEHGYTIFQFNSEGTEFKLPVQR
jgi:hypothetical protein